MWSDVRISVPHHHVGATLTGLKTSPPNRLPSDAKSDFGRDILELLHLLHIKIYNSLCEFLKS